MEILHAGKINYSTYLLLDNHFVWRFIDQKEASPAASSFQQALVLARQLWSKDFFTLLHCGFRYTLPTRDETGINATFKQMVLSYSASNGRYFDEEVGHLCYVDFASQEALRLWKRIRSDPTRS